MPAEQQQTRVQTHAFLGEALPAMLQLHHTPAYNIPHTWLASVSLKIAMEVFIQIGIT
jgi:hypothetical protein